MGVNIEKVFGENVFDDAVMKVRLPKSDYETVKKLMYIAFGVVGIIQIFQTVLTGQYLVSEFKPLN